MFELTDKPILPVAPASLHPHAGGLVTFEGRVRALNDGRQVTALDYEVYARLALKTGTAIVEEATAKFSLFAGYAVHRHGGLKVGDTAVWVYAASMHRRQAFLATEYIIHAIKHRVPIWKKEWYEDGASDWIYCQHGSAA